MSCGWRHLLTVLMALLAAVSTRAAPPASTSPTPAMRATYTNPVARNLPDPCVILHDGMYYGYGTNAPGEGYRVLTSPDLVNWTDRGFCYRRGDKSWGRRHFWAPCVIEHGGKFYLFYSAHGPVAGGGESHRICMARADSPLGPFVDVAAPLLDVGKATIDAHVLCDDDGKAYLYYALDCSENVTSDLYVVELSKDLSAVIGQPIFISRPDTPWEGDTWNEAPYVFKHRDTYILMYSARGFFDPLYSLGYATSRSPTGPFKKAAENPILHRTDKVSGPGHNSVVLSPDGTEMFCVYHIHRNLAGGHERDLAIDRMQVIDRPDGSVQLKIDGPTCTPQPAPSAGKRGDR